MSKILGIVSLCILLSSCASEDKMLGSASDFFPSTDLLRSGIVNKYYEHTHLDGDQDTSTVVFYRSYKMIGEELRIDYYTDVFTKNFYRILESKDGQFLLKEESRFDRSNDTIPSTISESVYKNWEGQEGKFVVVQDFKFGRRTQETYQKSRKDTTALGLNAIVFESENKVKVVSEDGTNNYDSQSRNMYVKGLGLAFTETKRESSNSWSELVEQIPMDDFLATGKEQMQRVGYIDTMQTIDADKSFVLCKTHNHVYQYYNGSQPLRYVNGKSALWEIVNDHIDPKLIADESGYLTFRFIVNCNGQAGRYVMEEADLNFQNKEFGEKTKDHFYEILQKMHDWIPTVINGEPVDAYFYLTFKLDDGQLIEILP